MSGGRPTPPSAENKEWETIRAHFQEALRENSMIDLPTTACDITSQYDLVRLIYQKNPSLGNSIINEHMKKHPVAMEVQKHLFGLQPGVMPLLVSVTMDRTHPLRHLKEYTTVMDLMNERYPTLKATVEQVFLWSEELDKALLQFLDVSLICSAHSVNGRNYSLTDDRHKTRINPQLFSKTLFAAPWMIDHLPLTIYQLGTVGNNFVSQINDVRIHGMLQPGTERIIVEIAKAHHFFLARKINVLKKLDSSPQLTIGLYNRASKLNGDFPMLIGYRLIGTLKSNETPVPFSLIQPYVCLHKKCHDVGECCDAPADYRYLFLKVSTVELGPPPIGATNTINFPAYERARAEKFELPAIFKENKTRNQRSRKRNSPVAYEVIWEENYLKFLLREFRERNKVDEKLLKMHLMPLTGCPIRLDNDFFDTFTLFMPKIYKSM